MIVEWILYGVFCISFIWYVVSTNLRIIKLENKLKSSEDEK